MKAYDLPLTAFGTASLGAVIDALERAEPGGVVSFDFCRQSPDDLDSYRGYYDHLALGWSNRPSPSAADVLSVLRSAVGKTYQGYKGGSYRMGRDTPLWVDNYSECTGTAIVGIEMDSIGITLRTACVD